jgi:ribonuclease-3
MGAGAARELDHDVLAEVQETLGVDLLDEGLLVTALTHKSWVNENPAAGGGDNERLEFLGDAVLDLAVGQLLMETVPDAREGELSQLRAALVDERGLARVARAAGVGRWLRLGRGEEQSGGRDKDSLLANALEALAAAVFLDRGWDAALALVRRHFGEAIGCSPRALLGSDHKSRLQEEVQRMRREPAEYRLVEESGPDHRKRFTVEVLLDGKVIGRGTGGNKKEAEQDAAGAALQALGIERGKDRG